MGSQVKLILLATTPGQDGALCPALSEIGGIPAINFYLLAVKDCPRLLPAAHKVFIVTSPETHEDMVAWASHRDYSMGGFPLENIINTGISGSQQRQLADASSALASIPAASDGSSHLVIASLDYCLGPSIPLRRIVEHSVVRGKGVITFVRPPPGEDMSGHAEVALDMEGTIAVTGDNVNPKVLDIDASGSQGAADGVHTTALAPIMFCHRSSVGDLFAGAASASASGGLFTQQLAHAVKGLMQRGKAVYGLHVDLFMPAISYMDQRYASAFLDFFHAEAGKQETAGVAAQALQVVTRSAQELGVTARGDKGVEDLMTGSSETKRLYLRFFAVADSMVAAAEEGGRKDAPQAMFGIHKDLPTRFKDASTWRHNPKKQHPVYSTTANDIGRKAPSPLDLPDVYAGSSGLFSKTFLAGPYRSRALVTSTTTSKVHKLLDDF